MYNYFIYIDKLDLCLFSVIGRGLIFVFLGFCILINFYFINFFYYKKFIVFIESRNNL